MDIFIAIFSFFCSLFLVVCVATLHRWLALPLFVAFGARLSLSLIHQYIVKLPQGSFDARVFEQVAFDWSSAGCFGFFEHFDPSASYVYSSILATFYACTERSPLAAQGLNVFVGLMSVVVIALIAKKLWGKGVARNVAWGVALFPALVIYSSVTLREVYVLLFFSLGVFFVVLATQKLNFLYFFMSFPLFGLASFFHGGTIFAAPAALAAFLLFGYDYQSKRSLYFARLVSFLILTFVVVFSFYFLNDLYVPKIGTLGDLDAESIASVVESRADGGAAYLAGLTISSPLDIIWQAPIRMFYFLFSPLPWQLRSVGHAFGMIDSLFYLYLSWLLFKHRKAILARSDMKVLLFMFLALLFVFSFGTSNFGTAMRHRAKFGFVLLVMVAPYIAFLRREPCKDNRGLNNEARAHE